MLTLTLHCASNISLYHFFFFIFSIYFYICQRFLIEGNVVKGVHNDDDYFPPSEYFKATMMMLMMKTFLEVGNLKHNYDDDDWRFSSEWGI
jgi:hypothetical protein